MVDSVKLGGQCLTALVKAPMERIPNSLRGGAFRPLALHVVLALYIHCLLQDYQIGLDVFDILSNSHEA